MGQLLSHLHLTSHPKSKAPPAGITDNDRALLSLKTQRRRMEDHQKLLDTRIDRFMEVARELLKEDKRERALIALRKKKMTEKQRDELTKLLLNIEGVLSNLELARQQNKVFGALQQGNDALKRLQQQVSADDVRQLLEETADSKAYQDEINDLLSQSLSSEDDAAAEAELEQLETMQAADDKAELPTAPKNPVKVPNAVKATNSAAEAEEAKEAPKQRQRAEPLAAC